MFLCSPLQIIPYDKIRTAPKKLSEGQARARFNFVAQTHLELSLVKGKSDFMLRVLLTGSK